MDMTAFALRRSPVVWMVEKTEMEPEVKRNILPSYNYRVGRVPPLGIWPRSKARQQNFRTLQHLQQPSTAFLSCSNTGLKTRNKKCRVVAMSENSTVMI